MFYEFTTVKGEKFTMNISSIEYFTETKKGTLIVCKSGMDYEVVNAYKDIYNAVTTLIALYHSKN